ncbi:EMILIN-2 isoform X2 [Phyllopteryx taeniolatus]|uniref:EMILIN-2 isoform X2 n=1 Tax=Phyllopteryx taeniolatus TaxID=161469 RepID=UPI002AD28412|nr:EMILIN-2 isoform X2 [Phyllopteryx taeniolatus]
MKKSCIRVLPLVVLLTCAQVAKGTPFPHGGAHSTAEMRQRNKNWCAHVVHKNVSCAVVAGSESFAQPEFLPCRLEMNNCAPRVIYRTHFRPIYKLDYKTVTELQWRCCPGFQGHDCMEVKSSNKPLERTPENQAPFASGRIPAERTDHQVDPRGNHPWRNPGGAPRLEDEVQQLSQMVLDMQARITDLSSNMRLDLQEDASKILRVLLDQMGELSQPASARGAETRTVDLFNVDELMNKISLLESRSDTWNHLEERVNRHDGQIQHLMEDPTAPPSDGDLRAYVDENIRALRKELTEGMEIKLADLKNSCDYKIMSMHHECEDQEEHYLSLTELMDSKENDLRRQMQELKTELEESQTRGLPDSILDQLKGLVNSSVAERNLKREQGEALEDLKEKLISMEDRVNRQTPDVLQNELNTLRGSLQTLENSLNTSDLGLFKANVTVLETSQRTASEKLQAVEGRLQNLESLHGGLSDVKYQAGRLEDLGCTGVISEVRQLEAERCQKVLKDVAEVARELQIQTGVTVEAGPPLLVPPSPVDTPPQTPLATETGEAGAPGRRTLSTKLPKGTHGSTAPVLGFAGAPASPVKLVEPLPYTLPSVADAAARHKQDKISFSAGLALPPIHSKVGVVRFDTVLVNDGGHYDPSTGLFTAPVDGRYLLSAVLAAQPGTKMEAVLSVDQRVVHRFHSRGGAAREPCPGLCAPASVTLVVSMRRGERAALSLTAGELASASAHTLSSFSGVLLYPSSR